MLFAVVVIIGAWYAFRPERLVVNRTVNEALPTSQGASSLVLLESGTFYSILHPTQGAATIYQLGDGARGLYYAATAMESLLCREREIIVVGGGNSAGQAAVCT